ncbi:mandelate racemase/muconate lactonizing enzyme family protein [Bradyrhizobium diazoefficiens]|uniref:mandelate racemase/muconate lactonizing enzyme family protein n=1 Tax=Bradyrhizobium diazoefficiens TaxID=1355477 RepID=UPI00190D14CF|nr:mandelate racemase/muconate lactonizing enzyme family protein [Bradyrhizobium diazoefficiens]QQO35542.1 mandelate racemase/muconate lactonizing enzyme family protein [Bradyrhizobium diazoefficiens]
MKKAARANWTPNFSMERGQFRELRLEEASSISSATETRGSIALPASMKITRILGFRVLVPLKGTYPSYTMSGGRTADEFDSTIVCVQTNSGIEGWGEVIPLGASYLPAYPEGARAGIREIAPALIGADPTQLGKINYKMDAALCGHPYTKSALDIACWDILGKHTGLPVSTLLGGQFGNRIRLYRAIPIAPPEDMAGWVRDLKSQGFVDFQAKVGSDPVGDIERIKAVIDAMGPGGSVYADANGGWTMSQAAQVVRAVRDLDLFIEQPCQSYEACLSVRRRFDNPFLLDESVDSLAVLQRAIGDRAMDAISLKVSRLGGLTNSRLLRDVCAQNGIMMRIEDTACTDIGAAAVCHLAHSTPEHMRLAASLANSRLSFHTATGAPEVSDGCAWPSDKPGLGIEPIRSALGEPIFSCE